MCVWCVKIQDRRSLSCEKRIIYDLFVRQTAPQEDDRCFYDSEDNYTEDSWFSEDRVKDKLQGKYSRLDQNQRKSRSVDGSDNDTTDISDTDFYDDEVYRVSKGNSGKK